MKFFILFLLNLAPAWSMDSRVIPAFLEAAQAYVNGGARKEMVWRPEIRSILALLQNQSIPSELLGPVLLHGSAKKKWQLPAMDHYDQWMKSLPEEKGEAIALHAFRIKVVEESDDYLNDDLYAYFFVTDGVIPVGKVSDIYRGLDEGQSFFFNESDRVIYPPPGIPAKIPQGHIIIDYGLVESDGDDIREMQKLTGIIVDIALAVYATQRPAEAAKLVELRREVKALAHLLLSLNHDDRLVTGSFGFKNHEISEMLKGQSYFEFRNKHKKDYTFDSFEYHLFFRLIKNEFIPLAEKT